MAILGEITNDDLLGMSPHMPEGAKKLLKDVGKMKPRPL